MNTPASNKRYACDRCRDQKLRCPRTDQNTSEPCARCQRAGAICVTSSTRPLGRPRNARSSRNLHLDPSARIRRPSPATTTTSRAVTKASDAATSSLPSVAPSPSSISTPPTPWPGSTNGDIDLSYPDIFGNDPNTTLFPDPAESWDAGMNSLFDLQSPHGNINNDGNLLFPSPTPPGIMMGMQDALAPSTCLHRRHPTPPPITSNSSSLTVVNSTYPNIAPPVSPTDTLLSLSRLNGDITQQISLINTFPWSSASSVSDSECAKVIQSMGGNPLAQAQQSAARFVDILRSLLATPPPPLPTESSAVSEQPTTTLLSTPTYLLVLSSYVQLMHLYDTMFVHVCQILKDLPRSTIEDYLPVGADFAGLPAMPGSLYAKIVIQIVEHQLESVEALMGLPAEHRICGRASRSRGIFSGHQDAEGLLGAVLGSQESTTAMDKVPMESLRENMKKARELIQV
ncbi:hypothetical protein B0H63DRAFT_185447 [Podospora didyma]|uniref:Zn(2)-C6 fungal-type domain-containing protein n=1 Tax=Podospora didyma TaxID=330526 RepID=A0AAE0NQ54_9PEZI|nr:hypothetical protein B0H63DRAFT_185447 [Podospora didyma]